MVTESDEAALRQRVHRAVRALRGPDRARLARIEQGLPRRPGRRATLKAWLLAFALGGGAAAAAAAGYWLATGGARPPRDRGTADSPAEASGRALEGAAEEPGKESGAQRNADGPVIYQR